MTNASEVEELLASQVRWLHYQANKLRPWYDADHDDIFQEGWIAMWRAVETYKPGKRSLGSWIATAARSRMIDFVFKDKPAFGTEGNRQRQKVPEEISLDALLDHATEDQEDAILGDSILTENLTDIETAYHDGEISDALSGLSPRERELVVVKFWGGLYEQTTDREAMRVSRDLAPQFSNNQVRSEHWNNAKSKLQIMLERYRKAQED